MSDKQHNEGHWGSHSHSSKTTQIDNQPSVTTGNDLSAKGTFDHGKPVVTESHASTFTDQGHPGTLEYKEKDCGQHPKSIK